MIIRTKDTYSKHIYDFIQDIYVVCPSCNEQGMIRCPEFSLRDRNEHLIKLVCSSCGYNKRLDEKNKAVLSASSDKVITGKYLIIGAAVDPYFRLPLWLTLRCCDNILWAYNYEHLNFLREHIEAKLRERNTQIMANNRLGSRLPKWMTSKKNRETVIKCIDELKNK